MTQAAARLGIDQTTVSRRLGALEATVGVKLVSRRRDGIALTEAGIEAARASEVMETVAHDLERSLVGKDTVLAGAVRLTTIDLITQHEPHLFTSFSERYPAVELQIETGSSYRSLSRREADVALRFTDQPEQGLFGRKLVRMEFALYANAELRASIGPRAKLSSYPWLAFTAASRARLTDAWMASHVPEARIVSRYSNALSLYAAVRAGGGIGFMPCAFADTDDTLVRLRGVQSGFGVDLWCLTHHELSQTARVRAVLAHVGEHFDARRDLYAGKRKRRP